ncbi:MAG: signal peptide peptidase SppA [Spirochaetales bacterium]|nr:signal peptide peptidase SppA [Spirochaetales bacterium]
MKSVVFFLMVLCCALPMMADPFNPEEYPITLTDDLRAVSVNPAALSYGAAEGFGFYQNPGNLFDGTGDFSDNLYFLAGGSPFGWILGKEEGVLFNTAALSFSPYQNIYLGGNFSWTGKELEDYRYGIGLLCRPIEPLSLAAVYRVSYPDESWGARVGLGVRPLGFLKQHSHRLELAVEMPFRQDGVDLPSLYLRAEPLEGVSLQGSWNLQSQVFRLGVSLSYRNMRLLADSGLDSSFNPTEAAYFIQVHPKEYSSLLVKKSREYVDYNPGALLSEHPGLADLPFPAFPSIERSVWSVIDEIEGLTEDSSIQGLVFRNTLFQASRTNFHELENALKAFKASGKRIIFYYEDVDTANYTLAAAVADKIYLNPLGMVALTGVGSINFYYNELFRRLGIETVDFQSHEYKTANNRYTKSTMTEAEREVLLSLFQGLQEENEKRIFTGREGRLSATPEDLFNHGPYLVASDALEAGLVDGLIYEAELDGLITDEDATAEISVTFPPEKVRQSWADPYASEIAIIYATGPIYPGTAMPGSSIGSDTLVAALRDARKNSRTKAIVLRVDSPGGSALASDIIAREIDLCRSEPYNLPVVVSMGAVAGSGGYYISCTSDYIFAHPDTLTGSIGVAGFNFNIQGLLEKIDVETVSLFTRDKADLGNITRDITEEEDVLFRRYISHVYDIFVDTVARGRGMDREVVDELGKGRIWTGSQAVENGLIDEIGSLDDALAKAKELAGITGDIDVKQYDGFTFNPGEMMSFYVTGLVKAGLPDSIVGFTEDLQVLRDFGNWKPVLLMPYQY